ncbi:hypothetical protein EIP86_002012 [Pleurotus ostreatoroseus]|nr:hypothetical protein EIP86_002012 [Pleurotus ostreatoroseus]
MSAQHLLASHPAVAYVGHVGELQDVRLLSVPKERWGQAQADILANLNSINGVKGVEVQQPPRTRVKRGDEF